MISASETNRMKSFLLLILSLMAGCEASSEQKGCRKAWAEFTCEYPETNENYQKVKVISPRPQRPHVESSQTEQWENKDRFSLYHDAGNKILRMVVKDLTEEDFGKYKCEFYRRRGSPVRTTAELKEDHGCQESFTQTAYRTAKTNITCDYPRKEPKSLVKFLCKENSFSCEEILSTQSPQRSNGTFTLTETKSGFNVSISSVSSQDDGAYWCGVKSPEGNYSASRTKIQLEVKDITDFTRSPTIGQNFSYWCKYNKQASVSSLTKFICKGEDPSRCQPLVSTTKPDMNPRFSMNDDISKKNITITVREVRAEDTGTYWCGAESADKQRNTFFTKLFMTVGPSPTSPSPVASTQAITESAQSHGRSVVVPVVIVCVAVLLLLLLLLVAVLIFVYKRNSKTTGSGAAAQHIKEDNIYEETHVSTQKPDAENAVTTIYVTANKPTNHADSPHYSTINFKCSSDEAGSEALIPKPSSSACQYSVLRYSQSPACSTINQPSRATEDPLYSTVNKPQQQ